MQYFKYLIFLTLTFFWLQSCKSSENSNNNIIPKDKLAKITVDIYLADNNIEINHLQNKKTDTLGVYHGVLEHYGYTIKDYENSIEYYLKNKDEYVKILNEASKIASTREDSLSVLLDIDTKLRKPLWAVAEIDKTHIQDLELHPYYRSIRWIMKQNDTIIWKMREEAITDIPSNFYWWKNNMKVITNDTLPTLTKEYTISNIIKERVRVRDSLYKNGNKIERDTLNITDSLGIKDKINKKLKISRPQNLSKNIMQKELEVNKEDKKKVNERERVDPRTGNPVLKVN